MHIVIIGNGITGITAARTVRKRHADWRITVISGESDFHYSRPALMYLFMGHMRMVDTEPYEPSFWRDNRIELRRGWVTAVDTTAKRVVLGGQDPIRYDRLLLATGSKSNRFGWPGQDLDRVQGLYSVQDVERLENAMPDVRRGVIVGGGLIGIELAEMLHSRHVAVTFLVREDQYWNNVLPAEESAMVSREIRAHGIDLRLSTDLAEIHDDGQGRAGAVTTGTGERIDCELVGLTAGVSPNLDLAKAMGLECGRGIRVDDSLRTSVPDVYAAGDCAEIRRCAGHRDLVQQVWYTGRAQGELVGRVLGGEDVVYVPAIWFNSAKFLDLEYQTYGIVPREGSQHTEWHSRYWEHPDGRQAVRIVYNDDEEVIGLNLMGIRYRHRVCERWIGEGAKLSHVLDHLHEANFDPEFSRRHESAVRAALGGQ